MLDFSQIIIILPILLFSVIVHEYAHGWVALKCGDPTARDAGRLTFNPLPHIDPFMTIILPALLIFSGSGFIIGGAKPVPVNPYNFKRGERDNMLVSFAGPASNILLALVAFILSIVVVYLLKATGSQVFIAVFKFLNVIILLNLILANFNLLPIPPLDGSHILAYFLKGEAKIAYLKLRRYGFMILLGIIMLGNILPIPGGLFHLLLAPSFKLIGLLNNVLFGL
jgi:Zn-dependent protease